MSQTCPSGCCSRCGPEHKCSQCTRRPIYEERKKRLVDQILDEYIPLPDEFSSRAEEEAYGEVREKVARASLLNTLDIAGLEELIKKISQTRN